MKTTYDSIDLGFVPCACGCGLEATQFFHRIPIAEPACYALYIQKQREAQDTREDKSFLKDSRLEHFTSQKQFEQARRLQTV